MPWALLKFRCSWRMGNLTMFTKIKAAARRLQGLVPVAPVMTSRTLDQIIGARVYFKCENLQRIGAFKFRGAYNAISQLSEANCNR